MSIADVRDAFNSVGEPAYSCSRAQMNYTRNAEGEWQILTFTGRTADNAPFSTQSPKLPGGADLQAAAKTAAQALIDGAKTP